MPEFSEPVENPLDAWIKQSGFKSQFDTLMRQINDWMNEVSRKLAEFLERISPDAAALGGLPNTVSHVLIWTIGAFLAFLVLAALYVVLTRIRQRLEHPFHNRRPLSKTFEAMPLVTSSHHNQLAQKLAAEGRFDQAVRQVYLGLLCLLNERQWAVFDESRSNQEYLELLRLQNSFSNNQDRQAFQTIARQFEATHYGHLPTNQTHFDTTEAAYQQLVALP